MARSINESGSSWVFPDGPLEEIASRCDVITAASLVGSCKFYHDSATQSVALPASQPFGMPCVLHTHQTEVPPAHNPFSRVHKFKQQGAQKDKQHDAKDRKGTLCQLTPLDRISSDAVIPDGGTGMWAGANGDWIALLGFPWNWELVNVYTGRRIPLPPISEFKSTPDKLVFESNDQHLQLLKIAICRVPTAASNYTSFSVLAIFNAAIAVLHCASSRWTVLDNQFLAYGYSDAIIHKGIVFAVTQTGEVYAWNQLSWGPLLISTAPIPPELDEQGRYNLGSWWLARSPDGSRLFLVHTWGVTDGRDYTGLVRILPAAATSEGRHGRTIRGYGKGLLGCEVYSMDTSQLMPPRPWRRIISLGSYSLFLGVNYPIIIPVEDGAEHDRPNMARSNSVYTSHHAVGLAYPPSPEICRFSLNSEDCTVGFQTNIRWTWRQVPLWLIPSFANARQWNLPSRHRLCRGGGDGHLEALTGDNIDLIAAHLDVTYTVRLAACSRELYDRISKDEGKMHHWDEPCLLMPPPAYWFDEHWDVARASRLHDTVYDLVPLDHPRRSVALPFMHDRKWLGANGDWIAAADHHGWCLVNVYTERHIPLPSLPDSKIRHSIVSYRPAYSFNWGPAIYLLKIVICQVPTKGGRYADYKLIALFDKTIFYLEGGGDWRMLEALTPAPDYPNYCDAIELRGHVFAVDETDGSTYFWDTANENLMLPFVIPPPVVDDQQYAWFLAPSADGKRLMIILTVNKIGIANAEVPPDIPYAANGLQLRQYPPVATYVFELDPLSTARAGDFLWRQVNSLSDHSLFLGLNYPIIANLKKRESKAPDGTLVPFMRKNCVYTAYRNIRYNQYPKILRCNLQPDEGETVGVISLPKDGWDSEFQDVFPDELPHGLPPLRGIEHRIDLIPGAPLPNRAAYRTNPEDTKEIQRQIQDLLAKGEIVRLHGVPRSIVSDRDVKFMSYLWKTLMAKFNVKLLFSSSSHPQTDGQTEVVNRSLSTLLRVLVKKNLKAWEDCIPHAEFAYNRAKHSTTMRSPFMVVYGFEPPTAIDLLPLPLHEQVNMDIDKRAQYMKKLHEDTRATIEQQVLRQATRLNMKKKARIFNEGDLVWIHLRKDRFPQERNSKLKPRGDGTSRSSSASID
ncbi:hypothetical protein QYE76_011225 [Lolium multiflorum]|uniref:Integrase catalytic domain-containing protein n=1 Tax=Lolium multiflorum TaxID=4521 RepID=A0AAD8TYR3_LOLMU|nr:hypothetical protein QYE76_011225 [Lolium multiflorum]